MGLKKAILTCLLQICNFFFRLFPIKQKKITFISLTANHLQQDFLEIDTLLKEKNLYEIHYNLIVFKKTLKDDFMYMLNCIKQLYEINTSKLIILNDNNFVVTKFKRKHTYVIQTWHACGAIKKFGNQIERQYPIQNYDIVLSNSKYWNGVYSEAFGVSQEQIFVSGMPRVDKLCKQESITYYKNLFHDKYPGLKGSYKILYAPTFRGNIIKGLRADQLNIADILKQLPEDYVMMYKMHPLLKDCDFGADERLINVNDEDLYMLLCACDVLVTDYSSIIFDYSLLGKKAICYASDYEEYEKTIGFNVDYLHEMPENICSNEEELLRALKDKTFDIKRLEDFQKHFMTYCDGMNTKRVVDKIIEIMHS